MPKLPQKRYKIVIFGKGEAGKSTLIQRLIPTALNVNHNSRTVALDFGYLNYKGLSFHFFGTPGQKRFQPMRRVLSIGAHAAVYVHDTSVWFNEVDKEILDIIDELRLPFIIFVNIKPNHGYERRGIHRLFGKRKNLKKVIYGSAMSGKGITELLDALCDIVDTPHPRSSSVSNI